MITRTNDKLAMSDAAKAWYDELDPCCQKEIDNNRENDRIKRELRKTDRSNSRYDLKKKIFNDLRDFKLSSCYCCSSSQGDSKDYLLLASLRYQYDNSHGKVDEEANEKFSEYDSDDEFLDNDEFLSELNSDRMRELAEKAEDLKELSQVGFTVHCEESADHIAFLVKQGVPIVCHIYIDSSILDARLDLFFETLASKYLGTMFRRLPYSEDSSHLLSIFKSSIKSDDNMKKCGWIVVFYGRELKVLTSVEIFGNDFEVYERDIIDYLDQTRVLSTELNESSMLFCRPANLIKNNDSDEEIEETGKFCDDKSCRKMYAHEHVGGGRGATFAGSVDRETGAKELLATNTFYRV